MPFSGIPLVARFLRELGLDLGPREELCGEKGTDGELCGNRRLLGLNDEVLDTLGAAWNSPPEADRWARGPELAALSRRAAVVTDALALVEPWGWADPRNSVTLPFWRSVFPDLRVVVCLRHPHEVASSLEAQTSMTFKEGLELWRSYYGAIADAGGVSVVTDCDRDPEERRAAVERLVEALGLTPSRAELRRAVAMLAVRGAHELPSDESLPLDIRDLYRRLLEAASATIVHHSVENGVRVAPAARETTGEDLREAIAAQRVELENLRLELIRRRGYVEALQAQLDVRSASDIDLGHVIHNLEVQLLERDAEIATLRENHEQRLDAETHLRRAVEALEEKLAAVETTRLWRLGLRYWRLKQAIRRIRGGSRS